MSQETSLDKQDKAEITNYTRTPNMLIFGYHDTISPQEKWLYVCLKHLCGKKGTRHLSVRYISEQTGISTGALSKSKHSEGMIRHLHDAGLIHAEIKKPGHGNPQYHITITDVWTLNQAFFRSEFGQAEDTDAEPVRISDEPVQNSDRLVHFSDRSVQNSDEPVRISANTKTSKITEQDYYKTTEQDDSSVSADASRTNETSYHIAGAIGNVVKPLHTTLPSKGANHADPVVRTDILSGSDRGDTPSLRGSVPDRPLEQTPGPGALPSSVETPHLGRSSGITRDQATPSLLLDPEPAQSTPPTGSVASDAARTAQATGKPEKPSEAKETAKQKKTRLERRRDEIIALHCQLLGRNVVRSRDELEGARLMAEAGSTDAEITITYQRYKKDKFWGRQLTLKNIAKLLDTTVANDTSIPAKASPRARPKPEDRNISIYETDPSWQVWQRPGEDQEWIWWQGEFWTPDEADDRGYNGGGGLYIQTQYAQGV